MFTGIIKYKTKVIDIKDKNKILTISFYKPEKLKLQNGQSININGICSTIKSLSKKDFSIDYMPETREKTSVNIWRKENIVNLEESIRLDSFLDGHMVQGHIDAVGEIKSIIRKGDSKIITVQIPKIITKFISPKGSVAIDGVSLTVTQVKSDKFSVALIPYTLLNTNLGKLENGDKVNIETDIIARYLYHFSKSRD